MPQKKTKKSKNSGDMTTRALVLKEDDQEYGKITKMLGDRKVTVTLIDGSEILGLIPGKFRKRVWFKTDDIVLVGRREFQDDRVDIIYKYHDYEARKLLKMSEVPPKFLDMVSDVEGTDQTTLENDNDFGFDFDDI